MRRWGLWVALMLSVGVNIGVLLMVVADRRAPLRLEEPQLVEPLLPDELADPVEVVLPERPEPLSAPAEPAPTPEAEPEPPPRPEASPPPGPPSPSPPSQEPAPRDPLPSPQRAPSAEALRRAEPKLELLADKLRLRGRQRARFLEAQRRFFTEVTARRVELATLRRELRRAERPGGMHALGLQSRVRRMRQEPCPPA